MKIKINFDVYDISNRIKKIDKNYYIVFNTSKNCFEIHNSAQHGTSYCLTLPFAKLDARTLKYVHQTKAKNIDKILNQIETDNKLKENAAKSSVLNQLNDVLEDEIKRR